MDLFNTLKNVSSSMFSADHSALATATAEVLGNQPGGLQGVISQLSQGGLGAAVNSWVGTGENAAVTGDQIHQALGADVVAQIAARAGISPDVAKNGLAMVLPMLIDRATPNGQVGGSSTFADGLGGLLSMFGGRS
jgi:uncharacterized protein YidB (DUF937 family)